MRSPLRYGIALLGSYLLAWTIAYMVVIYNAVLRIDFSEYFHWFVLAWTFRGFEIVAITWMLSITIFVPLAAATIFLIRRLERSQNRIPE